MKEAKTMAPRTYAEQYHSLARERHRAGFHGRVRAQRKKMEFIAARLVARNDSTPCIKYDSGSGWPSFYQPATPERVDNHEDSTLGMRGSR